MSTLYDRMAGTVDGGRYLAAARLRYDVLGLLHKALTASGVNQTDLAKRLGVRKSAVNGVLRGDGNLRLNTMAEYLHELGFEADVHLVPAGEHRRATREDRAVRHAFTPLTVTHTHPLVVSARVVELVKTTGALRARPLRAYRSTDPAQQRPRRPAALEHASPSPGDHDAVPVA